MKASVAICTHNGAERLEAVLAALSLQTFDASEWEVLVIDNASTDETVQTAMAMFQRLFAGRGRVVNEPQLGLSYARARAAREAGGEIICFLDDDNIPAPEFVEAAVLAFVQHPKAGVLGGKVLPRWETLPTPLSEAVASFALAICDEGEIARQNNVGGGGVVGAGMCVRREVLRRIYESGTIASRVTGRTGKNLMGGEDLVISIKAKQLGWEIWYVPTLHIEHVIPARRMEKEYLLRLFEGIGRGQAAIRPMFDWKARTPAAWLIGFKDLGRWVIGCCRGPSSKLRGQCPLIASEVHCLQQRQVWGRALQAMRWGFG